MFERCYLSIFSSWLVLHLDVVEVFLLFQDPLAHLSRQDHAKCLFAVVPKLSVAY